MASRPDSGSYRFWSFWAIVGPIVAGLGVALIITVVGRARGDRDQTALDKRYGGKR